MVGDDTWDRTSIVGLTGSDKWSGVALAGNGKLYFAPYHAEEVLIVDPSTDTADRTSIVGLTGSDKWWGVALAGNGKLYFAPRHAEEVLIVDPSTDTADRTSIAGLTGSGKWRGVALAGNGKLYFAPYHAEEVMIVDPSTDTVDRTSIAGLTGPRKWIGVALAGNGKLYFAPYYAEDVLIVDPLHHANFALAGCTTLADITCDGSGITTPANADAPNTGTAAQTATQAYASTLVFTCSAGYSTTVTYTCGQAGSFTTTDSCVEVSCPFGSTGTDVVTGDCSLSAGFYGADFSPTTNAATAYVTSAPVAVSCPFGSTGTDVVTGDCTLSAGFHGGDFTPTTNAATTYVTTVPVAAACPAGSTGTSVTTADCALLPGYGGADFTPTTDAARAYVTAVPAAKLCEAVTSSANEMIIQGCGNDPFPATCLLGCKAGYIVSGQVVGMCLAESDSGSALLSYSSQSVTCTPCAAGQFWSAASCHVCPSARHQAAPGSTECVACPGYAEDPQSVVSLPGSTSISNCLCTEGYVMSLGICQRSVDCVGAWAACSVNCTKTFVISTPQEGLGMDCITAAHMDTMSCAAGVGECPRDGDCSPIVIEKVGPPRPSAHYVVTKRVAAAVARSSHKFGKILILHCHLRRSRSCSFRHESNTCTLILGAMVSPTVARPTTSVESVAETARRASTAAVYLMATPFGINVMSAEMTLLICVQPTALESGVEMQP
jgi:hypothetical protein